MQEYMILDGKGSENLLVWAKVTSKISDLAWVCTFLSLCQRTKKEEEDVIQYLPIKLCPGACLANAVNLRIFKDSSLAVQHQWRRMGGYKTISPNQPHQQKQCRGTHDGQHLIRGSPEQVGYAQVPQGFVKEENISANTPPLFIYSFSLGDVLTAGGYTEPWWTGYCCLELIQWWTTLWSTGLAPHAENQALKDIKDSRGGTRRMGTDTSIRK